MYFVNIYSNVKCKCGYGHLFFLLLINKFVVIIVELSCVCVLQVEVTMNYMSEKIES